MAAAIRAQKMRSESQRCLTILGFSGPLETPTIMDGISELYAKTPSSVYKVTRLPQKVTVARYTASLPLLYGHTVMREVCCCCCCRRAGDRGEARILRLGRLDPRSSRARAYIGAWGQSPAQGRPGGTAPGGGSRGKVP